MSRNSTLLLVLMLVSAAWMVVKGQTPGASKLSCTPCEDYYGMGGWAPEAQILVLPVTVPGRYALIHIEDPDTGTWFIHGDFYIDINNYVTVQSGDTAVFQFTQNGTYEINFQGSYGIPNGACYHYGRVTVEVTDFPTVTGNSPETDSQSPTIHAFPNPTKGILHVEWQDKSASQTVGSLLGMQGELIRDGLRFIDGKMEIDLGELASGHYHLAFMGPTKLHVTTILKE